MIALSIVRVSAWKSGIKRYGSMRITIVDSNLPRTMMHGYLASNTVASIASRASF